MKKKQFSANQISSILKEFDNGRSLEELVRSYGKYPSLIIHHFFITLMNEIYECL